MENKTFTRFQCWQDERLIQVINKEAVSIDRSNFLATHAPLNRIHDAGVGREISDKTEMGIFNELRSGAEHNRHTFMVIQGIPGTGKSHLIRWLKERYDAENREANGNDVILLIERAYCNLRGTLLQIIESGVFDQTTLHNHLQRLQDAATKLSSNTLADTIIDQIRNATGEVELPDEQRPRSVIRKCVYNFLLDANVRKELKKPGGPIDRIRKYLSDGDKNSLENHEIPGFEPRDFEFDIDTLRAIRDGGYKEARKLAEYLHNDEEPEWRQELATYFNRFLNYAVGRTTALSADDLKQIFNELRRQLRKQNRNLALFIEDITAFTGIDEGLIDVLATQHTGEGNREFCRLQSVIGITDNYFNQHFPDNMKERVSHRFTLNAETTSGTYESELLNSSKATADLSARYLNAIRLSQDELDEWVERGAHPENLPNACNRCPFKATCHDAFGYVDLHPTSEGTQRVGLYPFNEEAIWTMYQQLDRSSTAHTPRSLLSSVVGYVLESHGSKIQAGEFPPQANHMGSDFRAPSLYNLSQRQLLRQQALAQGGSDTTAIRLESLILFWGTRSINASIIHQRRLVGGLPQEVFQAFSIPFIEGEVTSKSSISKPPIVINTPVHLPSHGVHNNPPQPPTGSHGASQTGNNNGDKTHVPTGIPPALGRYTEDINNWSNGAKLQNYEKLRELLVSFIETSIDWEMHGISTAQVKDRIKPLRMAFEDQVGKTINTNDSLVFKRSMSMVMVLQALDYLNVNSKNPAPEQIGGHLTFLSSWLTENEANIVAFAQRPTAQSSEKRPLISIALANCVLLSCLQGTFEHKSYSARELLSLVLTDCVRSTDKQWQNAIAQSEQYRSKKWTSLMTGVVRKENYINTSRKSLLQLLNRPQGGSSNVRFIDADLALDILEKFEQDNWNLSPMEPVGNSASKEWAANYEINQALIAHFGATLKDERALVTDKLNTIQELIANSDPKEVFAQIQKWIDTMKQLQKPYQLEVKSTINAQRLARILNSLEQVAKENRPKALALRLSGIISTQKETTEHLQFLQSFKNEVGKQLTQLQQRFDKLRDETARSTPPALVERNYQEVENIIQHTLQEGQEVLS